MNHPALFTPVTLGTHQLPSRIVMAPMTRLRAPDAMPNAVMAEYYAQRAGAGLIVTECVMISDTSAAYMGAPGLYADRFIDGWKGVTDAVHARGGRIFAQLWHSGRVAHVSLMPDGQAPLAPSAIAGVGELHTPAGKQPLSMPRELAIEEVAGLARAFGKAADRARRAGFDGVEIHGAFGYLVDQFLRDGSNQRADAYGGPARHRARFLLEVVAAAQQAFGPDVGVKLSPASRAHGMTDSRSAETFAEVLGLLGDADLAYLHMMEPLAGDDQPDLLLASPSAFARRHYVGTLIANGGFSGETAAHLIEQGGADLVSFGQPFIANPDFPARLQTGASLAMPDYGSVYGIPGQPLEKGYTDYLEAAAG
ncbi:alkene reductase [Novosphingobium sediminis]|uniref:Alkene reductase n=1 Tax=Novosphingobium sediminis TaxID=707214 RepID=A0A512API9_9SPHN|nr:alkene reductase [Novosphingobium sediminis]GEO01620.1 alkene reductase [Novosphingobium sediminis]